MNTDWKAIATVTIPIFLAVAGWLVVDRQNRRRDRENKLRELRTTYLIAAYRDLADGSQRPFAIGSPFLRKMESAFADIQLFGSKAQVSMVAVALEEFSKTSRAPLDPLLNDLRNELREELHLEPVQENVIWFRPEGAPGVEKKK